MSTDKLAATSLPFDNLVVVFDVNGVVFDDVKDEVEKFIPKFLKSHNNLHSALYSGLVLAAELTLVGKRKIEEKLTKRKDIHTPDANIESVVFALEGGAKVRILTANSRIAKITKLFSDAMDERSININSKNFIVEHCETRKKPMYIKKLQEEELKDNRHVVFLDDSRILPFIELLLFIGTKHEEKPYLILVHGNRLYEKLGTKTVECNTDSINKELLNIADKIVRNSSHEKDSATFQINTKLLTIAHRIMHDRDSGHDLIKSHV